MTHLGSVSVGLEPVAVQARTAGEVWVVNHLTDSVSVIDASRPYSPRVVRTILVGDEPRDIVFAGPGNRRAFVTTAHRGQNSPVNPGLTVPGTGQADVWVFDAAEISERTEAPPLTIITLFTDTPRALAVSNDGARVYAAGFYTGNRTTTVFEELVPEGALPSTRVDAAGEAQPKTGLIVQHDGAHWKDETGRQWDNSVRFSLPDKDVFI